VKQQKYFIISEMMKKKSHIKMLMLSSLSLILAYTGLLFIIYSLVSIASYITGFEGVISLDFFGVKANAQNWNIYQVLAIYLLPFLIFLSINSFLRKLHKFPKEYSNFTMLFYSWLYCLNLILLFFIPIWDVINKSGIYYALSWLNFTLLEQYFFGIIMMFIFLYKMFQISSVFSSALALDNSNFIQSKQIMSFLPFIWYIPVLIFSLLIFLLSPNPFNYPIIVIMGGLYFCIILNSFVIIRYRVIVK